MYPFFIFMYFVLHYTKNYYQKNKPSGWEEII